MAKKTIKAQAEAAAGLPEQLAALEARVAKLEAWRKQGVDLIALTTPEVEEEAQGSKDA